MESNLYPIIGMSFHPEHILFEENTIFNVPDSFEAIKTARFIGILLLILEGCIVIMK